MIYEMEETKEMKTEKRAILDLREREKPEQGRLA